MSIDWNDPKFPASEREYLAQHMAASTPGEKLARMLEDAAAMLAGLNQRCRNTLDIQWARGDPLAGVNDAADLAVRCAGEVLRLLIPAIRELMPQAHASYQARVAECAGQIARICQQVRVDALAWRDVSQKYAEIKRFDLVSPIDWTHGLKADDILSVADALRYLESQAATKPKRKRLSPAALEAHEWLMTDAGLKIANTGGPKAIEKALNRGVRSFDNKIWPQLVQLKGWTRDDAGNYIRPANPKP